MTFAEHVDCLRALAERQGFEFDMIGVPTSKGHHARAKKWFDDALSAGRVAAEVLPDALVNGFELLVTRWDDHWSVELVASADPRRRGGQVQEEASA